MIRSTFVPFQHTAVTLIKCATSEETRKMIFDFFNSQAASFRADDIRPGKLVLARDSDYLGESWASIYVRKGSITEMWTFYVTVIEGPET